MQEVPTRPQWIALTVEGKRHQIPLPLSPDDLELLDMYVAQCDALAATRWVTQGIRVTMKVTFNACGVYYHADVPTPDVVAEVLHRSRPLLLQKEPASFIRTAGLVGKLLPDPHVRSFLKLVRGKYHGLQSQTVLKISTTSPDPKDADKPITETLNSLESLLEWLNAYEYHRDRDKQERMASLTRMLSNEASSAIFLGTLAEAIDAVFQLGDFVALLTGHGSRLELRLPRMKNASEAL